MKSIPLFFLYFVPGVSAIFFTPTSSGQTRPGDAQQSWTQVKGAGNGTVTVYWAESRPFIYRNNKGHMRGIESEIMDGFKKYLKQTHNIDLKIIWKEANDFGNAFALIRDKKQDGTFGVSAFSITPEREREVGFSPPYMSDISVMISSKNVPVVQSMEEFNRVFQTLTAVTIRETTYEKDLQKLKDESNLSFSIEFIPSQQNILRTIEKMDSAFGFIDLPVYMMIFNNDPSVNVKRQNLFPVKRKGYAIIYPPASDWALPIGEYFRDDHFRAGLENTIAKYIDIDLYRFVESLAIQSNDPVILLTKEKEIQQRDLLGKSEQIAQETKTRNVLIAMVAVVLSFLLIIAILYRKRNEQKQKIEVQGKSLALKSEQLEKRNQHLVALNEEKNNLIKIVAHDLRTPINQVQGLAQIFLLENETLQEDQKMIIRKITDTSVRLNKMITNILDIDAIENNRVNVFMDDVSLGPLVHQVVRNFEKQAQKKNISLAFVAPKGTYPIKGDSLFLVQVFENLISNAIKFSEPGKPVEIRIVDQHGKVTVEVEDQGPGLTE